MGSGAEGDVLASEASDFGVAKAGLNGHLQQHLVPPPTPGVHVGSRHQGGGLILREKGHRSVFVALGRDGQGLLALQGQRRFGHGHVAEKRAKG